MWQTGERAFSCSARVVACANTERMIELEESSLSLSLDLSERFGTLGTIRLATREGSEGFAVLVRLACVQHADVCATVVAVWLLLLQWPASPVEGQISG